MSNHSDAQYLMPASLCMNGLILYDESLVSQHWQ